MNILKKHQIKKSNSVIVELMGGLANQLFQYANGLALSRKLNKNLLLDISFFDDYKRSFEKLNTHIVYKLDKFNIDTPFANQDQVEKSKRKNIQPIILGSVIKRLGFKPYYNNKNHFDNKWFDNHSTKLLDKKDAIYISGYFADQKYFFEIEGIIRKEFVLKDVLNTENKEFENKILNTNAVSIHIRRGDYVNNPFFANVPLDYYIKAINHINERVDNLEFFVFSDDLNWVKDNLKPKVKLHFVDINSAKTDYMELMLMATCKHNIIANSTFSWWGAWLNNNPNKIIIAPKIWFGNKYAQSEYDNGSLVPQQWIKL